MLASSAVANPALTTVIPSKRLGNENSTATAIVFIPAVLTLSNNPNDLFISKWVQVLSSSASPTDNTNISELTSRSIIKATTTCAAFILAVCDSKCTLRKGGGGTLHASSCVG